MLLCLDVGNTHICGGVFHEGVLKVQFRHNTNAGDTSDQLGIFLKNVLRENNLEATQIQHIGLCSVVPAKDYSLRAACKKYFEVEPFFLTAQVVTSITISIPDPSQVGADLLAGAISAQHYFPDHNIFIVDLGTATTVSAVSKQGEFLGVAIAPGLNTSMQALASGTAKLVPIAICKPTTLLGRSTTESIQLGLYYGHLGAIKEIIARMTTVFFPEQQPLILGTGGFAQLFEPEHIFDHIVPDLVLQGIRLAMKSWDVLASNFLE